MTTPKTLSKLERVPLREAWKHEATEFTPWLAETDNLNLLADALGLSELGLVASEHWVGDFKLDILCTDCEDHVLRPVAKALPGVATSQSTDPSRLRFVCLAKGVSYLGPVVPRSPSVYFSNLYYLSGKRPYETLGRESTGSANGQPGTAQA